MDGIKYEIQKEPKCILNIDVEIAQEKVKTEIEKIFRQIGTNVQIPGFRKGKVPVNIIKERYREEAKQEFVNKISPEVLEDVLKKEKIDPVTTPKITEYKMELGLPYTFKVKVEVYPEINLKKYKKLKLEKKEYTVSVDDIEETIMGFREKSAVLKVKDSAAVHGDFIICTIKAYLEGEEIALGLPSETMVEIGSDKMLPEFDDNIKGMVKGQEKDFDYKFAQDFEKDELRGKTALFKISVLEVKEKQLPDKQKVSENLGFDTVDKFIESVKNNLVEQKRKTSENELEEQILDYLIEKHDFEVPDGLIDENVEKRKKEMASYVENQGGDSSLINGEEIQEKVLREIKSGLILSTIAKEEKIEVSDEDRKKEEDSLMKIIGEDNEKNRELARKYVNDNVILIHKVFDMIKANAKIKVVRIKNSS